MKKNWNMFFLQCSVMFACCPSLKYAIHEWMVAAVNFNKYNSTTEIHHHIDHTILIPKMLTPSLPLYMFGWLTGFTEFDNQYEKFLYAISVHRIPIGVVFGVHVCFSTIFHWLFGKNKWNTIDIYIFSICMVYDMVEKFNYICVVMRCVCLYVCLYVCRNHCRRRWLCARLFQFTDQMYIINGVYVDLRWLWFFFHFKSIQFDVAKLWCVAKWQLFDSTFHILTLAFSIVSSLNSFLIKYSGTTIIEGIGISFDENWKT